MKIQSAHIRDFKRFTDLYISGLPEDARLVVLVGPNGSGKTSLFEAFNYWISQARGSINFDPDYHWKAGGNLAAVRNWSELMQNIEIQFHNNPVDPRKNPSIHKKIFYLRSAYRYEAHFFTDTLSRRDGVLEDAKRPISMIDREERVSDNYQRLVSGTFKTVFDPANKNMTAGEITDGLIGRVRDAMLRVFPDLLLTDLGMPTEGGTFFFAKGNSSNWQYRNLSGGEKAAFDLLLDFVTKVEVFDNTIFCIDEPELHMHSRLQATLIDELHRQLPPNCQLWIATHSVGMIRRAMEIHQSSPSEVVFLDFTDRNFDEIQVLEPVTVNRAFWKQVFAVALDDLSELVAPGEIVFCEGAREVDGKMRNPSFDATVYRTIFEGNHPNTEFVPLGGVEQVSKDAHVTAGVLSYLFSSLKTWSIYDRDDRSANEIIDLKKQNVRVLGRRDLENYLWDDEVLNKLCVVKGRPDMAQVLVEEKRRLLDQSISDGHPADDIKKISGLLYKKARTLLVLTGSGNDTTAFARDTLAPLITSDMAVYEELQQDIFGV